MCFVIQLNANEKTFIFFFFNDTATTEIYTLSLHDALPILINLTFRPFPLPRAWRVSLNVPTLDRKSTRLNSSHVRISYAVFCLKKKKDTCRTGPGPAVLLTVTPYRRL